MATIILVPGAWYGSWCWSHIIPDLERDGHHVLAIDLPGTSADDKPFAAPYLDPWVDYVTGLIEQQPVPVILVGHSRGGMIISAVAERVPDRVAGLIYLCALLLQDGESPEAYLASLAKDEEHAFVLQGDAGLAIHPRFARQILFNTTGEAEAEQAMDRLGIEPIGIVSEHVHLSSARFGSVPRAYIQCSHDRAIPIASQKAMQARLPCQPVFELASDHSPFLSAPDALTRNLLTLARTGSMPLPPSRFP